MHIHCFGVFGLNDVGNHAKSCGVVDLYGSGRLWMSHLIEEVLH